VLACGGLALRAIAVVPLPRPAAPPPPEELPADEAAGGDPCLLPDDADLDLLGDFITESIEYIENAEAGLLTLETDPEDAEAVNTIFRGFHTIKGTSAFLGLPRLSDLAHRAESLLSRARDKEIQCTGGYADLALRSVDMLKALIQQVQNALGGEPMTKPQGYDELMQLLADPEAAGVSDEGDDTATTLRVGDILVAEGKAQREEIETAAASQGKRPVGEAIVRLEAAPVTDVAKALRTQRRMSGTQRAGESTVRVRTDRLDKLSDMVGELVIGQSMVSQDVEAAAKGDDRLSRNMNQLGKITRELQEVSMAMRMVPVKGVFQKMARLVRDLARKADKEVDFVTTGSETELDRNVVEQIGDPLVHMIRNAVDHGIEPPDEREAAGKPRKGRVDLRAFHKAGNVIIEIEDDGKGLDKQRILKKAVDRGLVREGQDLSDQDVFRLIFSAGLSTAEKVTNVSGRGVGMDVVRKNIESLRGRVDINSTPGRGSVFTIRLPLTLAVIDGQLITVGSQRYIIPTTSVERCLRPKREQLSTVQGRGEMVVVHKKLHQSAIDINKHYAQVHEGLEMLLLHCLVDHKDWAEKVSEAVIEGKSDLGVVTDPTKCRYGRFLESEEYEHYAKTFPIFKTAVEASKEPHRKLHASAITISEAMSDDAKGKAEAERLYKEQLLPALESVGHCFHEILAAEGKLTAAQSTAHTVFDEKTLPLLKETLAHLDEMKHAAAADLAGMNKAMAIYAGETLPFLKETQGLLHEIRDKVKNAIMTEEVMLESAGANEA